ncbi:hypothetical protein PILCRDRAFT_666166 [Piloderma croceum F 1598]|uniref:Protein SQS1 n=1 Tax=Piloderma croceum (strain F 1598) TaxID=765440 RepID=A0A0C3F781_PILCF|nr:hypothetical protein PILCRDRAFT_666166 [Piloderma croceum F 1598]
MGRIREEVDAAFTSNTVEAVAESRTAEPKIVEERFTGVLVERTLLQPKDEPRTIPARDDTLAEEMGFYADSKPASDSRFPRNGDASGAQEVAESTGFFIDTTPATTSPANTRHQPIIIDRMADQLLGEDEEIIVYVAPHPRVTKAPIRLEPAPSLPSTSILTGTTSTFASSSDAITAPLEEQSVNDHNKTAPPTIPQAPSFDSISFSFANEVSPKITPKKQQPRTRPVFTAGERNKSKAKARKKEARAARRRLERRAMFGSFGAIMSEAQLRGDDEQVGTGKDPRWEERRRGDSDIDWGDTDEGDDAVRVGRAARVLDGVDEVSNGVGAMELDSEIDMEAMKAFVKGMSANGGRHVTMDDIADEEQMRLEDASGGFQRGSESGASDSDGEIEEEGSVIDEEDDLIKGEEEMMMGVPRNMSPSDDDGDEDDLSDEIDQSPNSGFQARLQRLRKTTWRKQVTDRYLLSEEDTSDDDFFDGYTRAEEDDDFIAHVEDLLDAKGGSVLSSAEREARKRLFQAVQNGEFSDPEQDIGPTKRKKGMNIPIELQDQWARDRSKKAENKRARAKARLEAAADPLLPKKGGKKGHKAILAAAKLDPSSSIPERVVDMVTLEQQIRRFLADISGKATMVLPPMNKESRKQVHELATAFHLKSQSKGKGDGRYTTLMKTTRSGIAIDERKVGRVVKHGRVFMQPGAKGKNAIIMPRHKDGDEVGKAAPKIGEANIGFKMLASMGWSEGDRIGISGGLVAPLTAVIKNTKLGLGANR